MAAAINDQDDKPKLHMVLYQDMDTRLVERADRAARQGSRSIIDRDSAPEDITAAFRKHGGLGYVEDIYRIAGQTVVVEAPIAGPVDPVWYVIQCGPGAERLAVHRMKQAGLHPWLPLRREKRQVRNPKKGEPKTRGVDVPLVCGYAFLPLERQAFPDWRMIEEIDGVSSVLRHNGRPQPVIRMAELEELRRLEAEGHFDETKARPPKTKRGDCVRITAGPFKNLVGRVELTMDQRVKIVMDALFGQIDIGLEDVEVIDKPAA